MGLLIPGLAAGPEVTAESKRRTSVPEEGHSTPQRSEDE